MNHRQIFLAWLNYAVSGGDLALAIPVMKQIVVAAQNPSNAETDGSFDAYTWELAKRGLNAVESIIVAHRLIGIVQTELGKA